MRIALVAPLAEAVPPKFYGGTERVVSWLADELVRQGHRVTLFASAETETSAELVVCAAQSLRLAGIRDHLGSTLAMLREVRRRADNFDIVHFHVDLLPQALFHDLAHKCLVTLHGRLDLRSSKASATNLSPPESQSSSLSSPSPASSSLSSTRYCEIDAHGSKSPLDGQDSRSLIQPAQSVS
jgi:glycosyltransferase involved in cell wall biosynthesis